MVAFELTRSEWNTGGCARIDTVGWKASSRARKGLVDAGDERSGLKRAGAQMSVVEAGYEVNLQLFERKGERKGWTAGSVDECWRPRQMVGARHERLRSRMDGGAGGRAIVLDVT